MKILALDMSSKSTGAAIFEDRKLIKYECIVASDVDSLVRIRKMENRIAEIFVEEKIDKVIIEDVIPEDVRHNQTVFNVLHYLQAAVVLRLHDINPKVKCEFYVSSEWRKKCGISTGRGIKREELKAKDIAFVKEKYNIDVNDDIADAICIGYAYTNNMSVF